MKKIIISFSWKTNIVIDILPSIPYLSKFWFSIHEPKCCQPIKLQDFLKCNVSRKKWIMNFVFSMQINIEVFYKLILSIWVCVCVCLYSSIMKASSDWKMSKTCLRGTDQWSCVVNILLGVSAKFLYLYFWIYHISPPRT